MPIRQTIVQEHGHVGSRTAKSSGSRQRSQQDA